jgi:DNA-binding MarR family transcriptional regulator
LYAETSSRMSESDSPPVPTPGARVQRSLAGLELALTRHRRGARARLDVSDEELTVLAYLRFAGATAPWRLVQLSTLSRGGMDALLRRLEQQGLLERAVNPEDRRQRVIALTAVGRERVERAYRARDAAAVRVATAWPASTVDGLTHLLDALAESAEAAAEDSGRIVASAAGSAPGGPIWRHWG